MSDPDRRHAAHSHAHTHDSHGHAAHGHGDDAHDGGHHAEAEEETLASDEHPTPLWLTVLGAGLFLVAFILIAAV